MINAYVSRLGEDKKPTVYMEWGPETGKTWGKGSSGDAMCMFTGGKNLAATAPEFPLMSMEWMIAHNPQVIIKCIRMVPNTMGWSDIGEAQHCVDEISHRPGLELTDAVKNHRVYVYSSEKEHA
jgi:iron complex transport system substrate-binding protein